MTEKLLNKIRQNCCWWVWRRKSFTWRCWSWKKWGWNTFTWRRRWQNSTDLKIICSACHDWNNNNNNNNNRYQKLYVLQCICQKIVQKDTKILLQKRIKERDVSVNSTKYIPPKYICKSTSKKKQQKKEKTNWGEGWLFLSKL